MDEILGIDDNSVDTNKLAIRADRFLAHDLKEPLQIAGQFDLVLSLEVAEHLPEESAPVLVDSLTRLAPLVLFSAAIPFQAGVNHINEQWPEYWAEHFRQKGYVAVDCVRRKIWRNESVERWYAQNILLFVRQDRLGDYPLLQSAYEKTSLSQLSVVHPRQLLKHQADVEERDEVIRGLQAGLHLKVGECNEVIKDLHARLNEEIEARDKVISEMQAKLQLQQSEHTQAVARLREQLQSQTARSESVVADLWAQLGEIRQSKTWRLIGAYMRLRQKLGGGARNAKTADRG